MRVFGCCLLLVAGTAEAASTPTPTTQAGVAAEPAVTGLWSFAERGVTVLLYRSAGGLLQGKVVASPRPAEVGAWIVRDARWDAQARRYTGQLVTADAGTADLVVDLLAAKEGPQLRLVCSRFFLRKTLTWTRVAEGVATKEAP